MCHIDHAKDDVANESFIYLINMISLIIITFLPVLLLLESTL